MDQGEERESCGGETSQEGRCGHLVQLRDHNGRCWLMGQRRGRRDKGRYRAHLPSLLVVTLTGRDSANASRGHLNLFKQRKRATGVGRKASSDPGWGSWALRRLQGAKRRREDTGKAMGASE